MAGENIFLSWGKNRRVIKEMTEIIEKPATMSGSCVACRSEA